MKYIIFLIGFLSFFNVVNAGLINVTTGEAVNNKINIPKGPPPIITSLSPNSGPIGTEVSVIGLNFTDSNRMIFVGSNTRRDDVEASPVEGEVRYQDLNSVDGRTLTFIVPSEFVSTNENDETKSEKILPGTYYVGVSTSNGKSGISYFKVTNEGEVVNYISPAVPFVINANLKPVRLGEGNGHGQPVVQLQNILAYDKTIYPSGIINGVFDNDTENAVKVFQCKYMNLCSGNQDNGYGIVDLKTRFKIEGVYLLNKLDYYLTDGTINSDEKNDILLSLNSYLK